MSPDLTLLSTYLGFNAIIWIALYTISRDRGSYEKPPDTRGDQGIGDLKRVSILIPLYLENRESILKTVSSIARQRYPRDLYEVLLIVEEEDRDTLSGAAEALDLLRGSGISSEIYVARGGRVSKARALNQALRIAMGDIIAVYDADDVFDENQLGEAVGLMGSRGYDAIGVRVYRYGDGMLGKLIYIDTVVWFDLIISALKKSGLHVPLSGEGLYVRREVLQKLGGFPERLAEDAYLSLLLFEKGYRIGLLDSYVEEAVPIGFLSHIRQRIRWYRGHLECLIRILLYGGGRRLRASISYLGPVVAVTSLIMSIITIMITSSYIARSYTQNGEASLNGGIHSIAFREPLLLVVFAEALVPLSVVMLAVMGNRGPRRGASLLIYTLIMPIYWILVSLAAVAAIFMRRVAWYKTERSSITAIKPQTTLDPDSTARSVAMFKEIYLPLAPDRLFF